MKHTKQKLIVALTAIAIVLAIGGISLACWIQATLPVELTIIDANIVVTDQVAEETVSMTFHNPNQIQLEGDYYMEIEPGAQVDNLKMIVNGKEVEGEILDSKKAQQIYMSIVQKKKDPALLEYFGSSLIRCRVFPILPKSNIEVKVKFTKVLKNDGGLIKLTTLTANPKAIIKPLQKASVNVVIKSKSPIKNLYSPTHSINIVEKKEGDVAVAFEQTNYLPKTPFTLYYSLSEKDIGLNLLAHAQESEKGFFMLMMSPTIGSGSTAIGKKDIMPKDVVFCIDTSGSMLANNKMEQAKESLKYCVEHLNEGDRFNIIDFSTEARILDEGGLLDLTAKNKEKALKYIDNLSARGSTAIQEALTKSIEQLKEDNRIKMVIFMTDGLPNIGESDPDKLCKDILDKNKKNARIFVFGVGYDVNTKLLDVLASDNKGTSDYILPEEKIEASVSKFYNKVTYPVLADISLSFEGIKIDDIYPRQLNDLFKGGQVIVFGRYDGSGSKDVTIKGKVNGVERSYTYTFDFPKTSKNDFLPRLWAGRKVGFLLAEMKRNGPNDETIKEVVDLSKKYGIVTPYTSYLITEDQMPIPGAQQHFSPMKKMQEDLKKEDKQGFQGQDSIEKSKARSALEGEANDSELQGMANKYGGGAGKVAERLRNVGEKTFYHSKGVWYDSTYDAEKDKDIITIKFGSDEFAKLITDNTDIAKYLTLGNVVVKFGGKVYKIEVPPEEEKK